MLSVSQSIRASQLGDLVLGSQYQKNKNGHSSDLPVQNQAAQTRFKLRPYGPCVRNLNLPCHRPCVKSSVKYGRGC